MPSTPSPPLILLSTLLYNGSLTYGALKLLPPTLLRLAPIVSSTISLTWAYDEYSAFSAWINPAYREEADSILPTWFKNWAQKANFVLLTSFPVSLSTGVANVLALSRSGGAFNWRRLDVMEPRMWYGLGAFFSLAHMFFGPRALGLLAEIMHKGRVKEDGSRASATDAMGRWLVMHSQRTPTTDLPAFLCFVTGAVLSLDEARAWRS